MATAHPISFLDGHSSAPRPPGPSPGRAARRAVVRQGQFPLAPRHRRV